MVVNARTTRPRPAALTGASADNGGSAPMLLRTQEAADALGISRRQLQYWASTRLLRPSATTPGGHRRYDLADLVALKTAKRLIEAGISVQRIRRSIAALQRALPQVSRPLNELVLVATGDVVLVIHEDAAFEAVSGQEWVFTVAQFQTELASWHENRLAEPIRRPRTVRAGRRLQQTA